MEHREFISVAESLPLEMKIELIERLLKSITPSEPAIDQLWADEAERRVAELNAGTVRPIPGEEVFEGYRLKDF